MPDNQTVVLEYGGERIPVAITFGARKRLTISVHPDCSVTALAPEDRSIEEVLARLAQRRSWIARQRRRFKQFHPLPEEKRYVSGETHFYLGRQYRLRVHQGEETAVKLISRYMHVYTARPRDPAAVRAAMDGWYRTHATGIFQDRLRRCLASAPSLRDTSPRLRIRTMQGRWGSCSRAGTITLNLALIKTPLHCIEYVIMHELCHLLVHDHSPAFFRLLSRCMPDWQRRKARLDGIVLR